MPFFALAMALFIAAGALRRSRRHRLCSARIPAREAMPFHIMRMSHTNLLIVWLLIGFMGCTYYLLPEEAETEIHSPTLAYVQLGIFVFAGAAALVGYQFGIHEGREFLEQPFWVKVLITISFLMFLYNGSHDRAQGPAHSDYHGADAGPVAGGDLLAVRLLQPGQPGAGQDVLVVRSCTSGSRASGS
ncbi:MAG: cbb3-type cytochrome c oxidase subunit I [Arhodomonas sp.]|nr:cbb3-type cytochrome c oxidase subunit I [Arhodomonas sp.]